MLQQQLERAGFKRISFFDPRAALAYIERENASFDLAIIAEQMPYINGHELAIKLCQLRPGLPIILITGNPDTVTFKRDIDRVLKKPMTKEELLKVIDELIR
jgi:DNA-binding response OmpR family regulator